MTVKPNFHGSDLEQISEYYGIPKDSIVSFGANVNPLGLSSSVKEDLASHLDIITRYPDREYRSLRNTIASYCGADPGHVVVGNGATELISLLISLRAPKKALVVGPTYSEYERELALSGGTATYYNLEASQNFKLDMDHFLKHLQESVELLILCNPNNPTSSALSTGALQQILAECGRRNIFVMIDETYAEFAPETAQISAIPLVEQYHNLMVLRGVSKFFAAPGLRFGYGITSDSALLAAIKTHQNPWSLNSVAAYAGEKMLNDSSYIEKTRCLISAERKRILEKLSQFPQVRTYPASANFILVQITRPGLTASQVFEFCIRRHLMIRDCSSFQNLNGEFIRFCIMLPEDNDRLLHALEECLK